jgi:hypothetical protein
MKTKNKFITLLLLVAAFTPLTFTGCNKDPQPDQRKPITVQVKTEGLLIQEMKSFDPSQWTYNYNPNSYTLTFAGANGTNYTFTKSVYELQQGFAVSILPDTYTITYATVHQNTYENQLSQTLDITINETKTISTPTDLILQAQNDDYLVILDNNCQNAGTYNWNTGSYSYFFSIGNDTYKWGYYNVEGDLIIKYMDATSGEWFTKTIPNATKGNIYHIVSAINGTSTVNITPMSYNMIGW